MTIDLKAIRERAEASSSNWEEEALAIRRSQLDVPALLDLVDAMTGALLDGEGRLGSLGVGECAMCSWSPGDRATHAQTSALVNGGCSIDAALTLAGYPDEASRDAERARRAAR